MVRIRLEMEMNTRPLGGRSSRRHPSVVPLTVLLALLAACNAGETRRSEGMPPAPTAAEPVAVAFDVPSLIGKSIDELREVLGTPTDADIEPTQQQLDLGVDEWSNGFTNDGQDLLVTYNPRTRAVIDLFLDGSDQNSLLQRGNLAVRSAAYRIEPVRALRNPSQITGIKILPKM